MLTKQAYVTAVCDGCGKKYGIELTHLSGKGVRFHCRRCNEVVIARKPTQAIFETENQNPGLPDWVEEYDGDEE
jgi:predicted RNA-binding Zn-ribbon protein involved in translation (DUF1610 family)